MKTNEGLNLPRFALHLPNKTQNNGSLLQAVEKTTLLTTKRVKKKARNHHTNISVMSNHDPKRRIEIILNSTKKLTMPNNTIHVSPSLNKEYNKK